MAWNVAAWAALGSSIGAIAALLNTIRTTKSARDLNRTQNLFTLANQWNQVHYQDRIDTEVFVSKHPELELPKTHEDGVEGTVAMHRCFEFFELLQSSIDFKLVPKDETVGMFMYYFVWWDIVCAKASYPVRWDRLGRLVRLRQTMSKIAHYQYVRNWAMKDLEDRLRKKGIADAQINEILASVATRLEHPSNKRD
jgi:hypothetical protein